MSFLRIVLYSIVLVSFFSSTAYANFFTERGRSEIIRDAYKADENFDIQKYADYFHKTRNQTRKLKYIKPTLENLSRLYWKIAMYDPEVDTEAIERYVMVNNCQVYHDYYHNDFEWQGIVEKVREYLIENRQGFPNRFEFLQIMPLGRYDFKKKAFMVADEELYNGVSVILTHSNDITKPVCGMVGNIPGYPRNVALDFNTVFSLKEVPVPERKARNYLMRSKTNTIKYQYSMPEEIRFEDYERLSLLKLRVRIIKYLGIAPIGVNGTDVSVMLASIEGYDVYETPEMRHLLYSSSGN